jgi:radical SAM superfamily enzyme YgiQ (UPF0313 family)
MIAEAIKDLANVTYIDENHQKLPNTRNFDLVLICVETHLAPRAYELAEYYRRSGMRVVLGGPHVTLCQTEALNHADVIVTGPGEEAVRRIIYDMTNNNLKRVYDGMQWHSSFYAPRYDIALGKAIYELAPVVMSRGCQHRCSYCAITSINQGRISARSAEEVLSDINRIDSPRFYFVDDNLLANRKLLLSILSHLASSPHRRHWVGQVTHRIIHDQEIMDILQPSGCKLLFIGFDSLQPLSLRQIGGFKALDKDTFMETVDKLHELDISVIGSFMFGMDGDRPGNIISTAKLANQVGLDAAALNIFTPVPGTEAYKQYYAQGRIFEHDLTRYDFKNVVFYPKHFSPIELHREFIAATHLFYGFNGLFQRIRKMRNLEFMLPLNVLYNPWLSKALHLYWRNVAPQQLEESVFADATNLKRA